MFETLSRVAGMQGGLGGPLTNLRENAMHWKKHTLRVSAVPALLLPGAVAADDSRGPVVVEQDVAASLSVAVEAAVISISPPSAQCASADELATLPPGTVAALSTLPPG